MKGARRNHRALLRWHRRIGLMLAILFLAVLATGVLLNHAESLELRSKQIDSRWLFRWYGMEPSDEPRGFEVGEAWIVCVGRSVFLGGRLTADLEDVVGAVRVADLFAVAGARELILLHREGGVVERLTGAAVPPGVVAKLGRTADGERIVVATNAGTFVSDSQMLEWQPREATDAVWSEAKTVPPALADRVLTAYRGEGLDLHRIVLDLHSGRFFGTFGVVVVDLVAVGLLFLIVTGAWYAFAAGRNNR